MKRLVAAACALLVAGTCGALEPRTAGKAARAQPAPEARLRDESFPAALTLGIRLSMPAVRALEKFVSSEKRLRVGVGRNVERETDARYGAATLSWMAAAGGGRVARIELASPGASALRVGLRIRALPAGAELRFRGDASSRVHAIAGTAAAAAARIHGVFWSPVTEGASQLVEVWIPDGADADAVRLGAESASHLDVAPSRNFKSSAGAGAQGCEQDVACTASSDPALAQAARSVAKLLFTDNGATYLCTGTLVSDGDASSQVPYLYTAAHCIDSDAAAATLNTIWFYQAERCGGDMPRDYRQLTGGATLLHANASTDAALLRLADPAPDGAWFAGVDPNPLAPGEALVALHHPAGEPKKASLGQAVGYAPGATGASYASVAWLAGSTEGGSSGSGIFSRSGGEYLLRGGLWGGTASCTSTGRVEDARNRDYYSRIDLEARAMGGWLKALSVAAVDYTDLWWNPAESGWGVSVVQGESGKTFVVLFYYDAAGQAAWVVAPDAQWEGATRLSGTVYRTRGAGLENYRAADLTSAVAGSVRIEFSGADRATLTLSIDGRTVVKPIARQPI